MSDPEIARRCSHCGVSIRERAVFCPQCGEPVKRRDSGAAAQLTSPGEVAIAEVEHPPTTPEDVPDRTLPLTRTGSQNAAGPMARLPTTRERIHGAAASAREMLADDVAPRVDKLRRMSSVVIEQAAYDPSLRFILVAAVLFILFLVILVLSKWIG